VSKLNKEAIAKRELLEMHMRDVLHVIGEDPSREGLKETPTRVARMFAEVFRGYDEDCKPKITKFPNDEDGVAYDQLILDSGEFYSYCEHHMVPFFGTYHFGYIPDKTVLGLSKVARVVDYYSAKLQVQERLTKEIVDELWKELEPKGMALVLKARHLCREMRGVKKTRGEMTTSDVRGNLRDNPATRAEFFRMVNGN
jgi:GTP cyclohydrolase I